MSVYLNGRAVAQPVRNGTPYNALCNGRKVWTAPKDRITSVAVLNADGKPAPTSLPIDGSVTLAAQATYGDGHKGELLTTKGVVFATTTPDLVTVTGNKVAWKHGGTAVITATIDGVKSGPVNIACAYKPESITISSGGKPVTALTLAKDATVTIDVKVLPAEASQAVTVVSDHPDIVQVENVEGGGFGLTAVKEGRAAVTVTATGTDVSTIIEVGVAAPVTPTLPADAPAGVTLDNTHVKYAKQAVRYDVTAGGTVSALVFPSHNGKTQAQRVGLWVYVDPSNFGPTASSSYASVSIGRGNGGGNGAKIQGCDVLTGLHAGWNLCLFDDMAYGVGMTVSFRSQNGGSVWVDSLIVNPPMPAKTTVVFTHDVNPMNAAQHLAPLYQKYGLPFTWDTNNKHTGVSDQSIGDISKLGFTDWGVYSGISGSTSTPDYATGDWSEVVNAMTGASRITGLPRASYVASTNNRLGAAYTTSLSNAGWPLIRGTYGGGVATGIDPTYREVSTVPSDQYAKKIDEWAGKGYVVVLTAHDVLPDDQATGSTDTKLSEFEPLLQKTKQLVDAGTVEVITMRQLAQRAAPDALSAWDKQTN